MTGEAVPSAVSVSKKDFAARSVAKYETLFIKTLATQLALRKHLLDLKHLSIDLVTRNLTAAGIFFISDAIKLIY